MENKTDHVIKTHEKDARIAIIGAGPAGLTAAATLSDLGYRNVVVLEREGRVGGKCSSLEIDGRWYELGAGMVDRHNKTLFRFIEKYNIPLKQVEMGNGLVLDAANQKERKKRAFVRKMQLLKELFRYRAIQKKHGLTFPGFAGMDVAALSLPFSEFAKKHGIEAIGEELAFTYTGFGYGYYSDVPAAYILKYYSWETILSFIFRRMYVFPEGIEHLWTAVANDVEVRYNTNVVSIHRDDKISIEIEGDLENIVCDALIVCSPLDEMLTYIDATNREKELFSGIQHVDYRTIVCTVKNFPKKTGYAPGNFSATRAGHPVFWYHPYSETDIYTFYVLADGQHMKDETVHQYVSDFIRSLGGSLEHVHTTEHWKYFPHVSSERMKHGYYDALEDLQGERNTYYAGELLNFSTVGLTAKYAEALVKRFF